MAEKFLNKKGLERFYQKIKRECAPIKNPKFEGVATVNTPEFMRNNTDKQIINAEYASILYHEIMKDVYSEMPTPYFRLKIAPEEWETKENFYVSTKLSDRFPFQNDGSNLLTVSIEWMELDQKIIKEVYQKYTIEISSDGLLFILGEKPTIELPIRIGLFLAKDFTLLMGGS